MAHVAYNKRDGKGSLTLVGNWVEERVLGGHTGHTRYNDWTKDVMAAEDPYAQPRIKGQGRPDNEGTKLRCFTDTPTEPVPASSAQDTFMDPARRPQESRRYVTVPNVGRRGAARERQLMEEAAKRDPEPAPRMYLETTNGSEHAWKARSPRDDPIGRRVMKDRSGNPTRADPVWQAESGIRPKYHADLALSELPVEGPRMGGKPVVKPFGKASKFSRPIDVGADEYYETDGFAS